MNGPINRRRAIAAAGTIAAVHAQNPPASDTIQFGKPIPQTSIGLAADAIGQSTSNSLDGRALTVAFD
jgi:hypothetical protein